MIDRVISMIALVLLTMAAMLVWRTFNVDDLAVPPDVTIVESEAPSAAASDAYPVLPDSAETTTSLVGEVSSASINLPQDHLAGLRQPLMPARMEPEARPGSAAPDAAIPDRIILPTIGVDSPVKPVGWHTVDDHGQLVSEWDVADYAVGWHQTSAPLGAAGNTVMAGHNNIKGEVFRNLIDLKLGDSILVFAAERVYHYRVTQKLLLNEQGASLEQRIQNASWIAPSHDVRLTLVSCWPYTSNTHRVIIVAMPVDGS